MALFSSAGVFYVHFSHACIFSLTGRTASPVGASAATVGSRYMGRASETTEHCQLNLGSRLCVTGNTLGDRV